MELFNNKLISCNILCCLKPSEILKRCSINKNIAKLCNDEYLWRQHVKINYFINLKRSVDKWRDIAIFSERLLTKLFEHKLYPSYRLLQTFVLLFDNSKILIHNKFYINMAKKDIVSIRNLSKKFNLFRRKEDKYTMNDICELYNFNKIATFVKSNDEFKKFNNEFSKEDMKFYNYIIKQLSKPTKYFVNKVIQKEPYIDEHTYITIDYDIDIIGSLIDKYVFSDGFYEAFDYYKQLIFLKYFTDIVYPENF